MLTKRKDSTMKEKFLPFLSFNKENKKKKNYMISSMYSISEHDNEL